MEMARVSVAEKKAEFVNMVKERFGYKGTLTQEQVEELRSLIENYAPRKRSGESYFWLSNMRDEVWFCWDDYWGGHHSAQAFIYNVA